MCDKEGGKKCPFGFGSGSHHGIGGDGHGGCPYGFGRRSHGLADGSGGHCPYLHGGTDGHHGHFGPSGGHGFGGHGFDHHGSGPMSQCPWMVARMHACPWAWGVGPGHHGGAHCRTGKEGDFSVTLKVGEYCSEELEVKVVGREVIVHGKHDARPDQPDDSSTISREFTRRYTLGDDIDPETVASSLSGDNELTITATKKIAEGEPRVVPINVAGGSGDH